MSIATRLTAARPIMSGVRVTPEFRVADGGGGVSGMAASRGVGAASTAVASTVGGAGAAETGGSGAVGSGAFSAALAGAFFAALFLAGAFLHVQA